MKLFSATALLGGLAACTSFAQGTQTSGRAAFLTGACGQPQALTYRLAEPLDQVPMSPIAADMERSEPAYLEFTLAESARVVLQMSASDIDSYLILFGASGDSLGESDGGGAGEDAVLDLTLDAGTYCLQAKPYARGAGSFEITALTGAGADAFRPGGTPDTAACQDPEVLVDLEREIAPGVGTFSVGSEIGAAGRRDFVLTLTEQMDLRIDATSSDVDTTLILADAEGNALASDDDSLNDTDSRIIQSLAPGTYCVSLGAYGGGTGRADLTISDDPDAPGAGPLLSACDDAERTADFGTALRPGMGPVSMSGTVPQGAQSDWRLEVSEPFMVQIDTEGDEIDTVLRLLDETGALIDENDDGPSGDGSRITQALSPGRYCLSVTGYDGQGGTYDLTVTDEIDRSIGKTDACSDPDMTQALEVELRPGMGSAEIPGDIPPARRDWSFEITEDIHMRFGASSDEVDTVLSLSDGDGNLLIRNDDGPNGSNSEFETTLTPGRYCLSLKDLGDNAGPANVAFTELDAATLARQATERGEAIPTPESGVEIEELGGLTDSLQTNAQTPDQTKWVAFDLEDTTRLEVLAVSASGDFTLRLFDAGGRLLGEETESGTLRPHTIAGEFPAGGYLVGVTMKEASENPLRNIVIRRIPEE